MALDNYRSINALAETIHGLYKAEVIHQLGVWRSFEAVEFATLQHSNGWTGSIPSGCWSRSATSRRRKPRHATMPPWNGRLWPRDPNQIASGNPGAVHSSSGAHVLATACRGDLRVDN